MKCSQCGAGPFQQTGYVDHLIKKHPETWLAQRVAKQAGRVIPTVETEETDEA